MTSTATIDPLASALPPAPAAAAGRETVVHAVSLTKIFRDFWFRAKAKAVDGISFDIYRGEVFGLLGPNGSGKSTTIKLILGLLRPTTGKVAVFGKPPEDVAAKTLVGYLPEETYLYKFLNARETLDYYGRLFHLPRSQRRQRTDMLLEMVGLEAEQRRAVGEYSKGMQRRIGLAQALINDPDLLILDEPTTGLDPIGSRQIKDLILELSHRGKTILLCSHLLADVEDVCDRVAIMFGGKVRAMGTTRELLTQQDKTTIMTEPLDGETIEEIERVLERRGKHLESVRQPRQTLEGFFLDIVHQAQVQGQATSGARNRGGIAEFLSSGRGSADGTTPIVVAPVATAPAAPDAPTPPAAAPEEPVDEKALADMMGERWKQAHDAEDTPSAAAPAPAASATGPAVFNAPPTAEESAAIAQLGAQWQQAEEAAPPPARPPAVPGADEDDESPDTSFLSALAQNPAGSGPENPPAADDDEDDDTDSAHTARPQT